MATQQRLIWYCLFDSSTGQPFRKTTASSVFLPTDYVIDQFRQAVKTENTSILAGIVASQLLVYKNKLAFDKRHNIDHEKQEHLKSSAQLKNLGQSEDEALAVAIPSSLLDEVSERRC